VRHPQVAEVFETDEKGSYRPRKLHAQLEHFQEKWTPVFRSKMRPTQESLSMLPVGRSGVPSPQNLHPIPNAKEARPRHASIDPRSAPAAIWLAAAASRRRAALALELLAGLLGALGKLGLSLFCCSSNTFGSVGGPS